jgi:predicted transcriptional regulator
MNTTRPSQAKHYLKLGRGGASRPAQHPVQAIGLGCQVQFARERVYSDGIDLTNPDACILVGVTCRLCERTDCDQRALPSLRVPLRVDENVRGVSLYAPAGAERARGRQRENRAPANARPLSVLE